MINIDFSQALHTLRTIEKENFKEVAERLFNCVQSKHIDFTNEQNAPWLNLEIFHLDDEVKNIHLTKISYFKGSEVNNDYDYYEYSPNETYYHITGIDGNGREFTDEVYQLQVGELDKLTKYLEKYREKMQNHIVATLYENYLQLSKAGRCFILDVLGLEEIDRTQFYILYDIVNGTNIKWNNCPYNQSKTTMIQELTKGL